MNIDTPLTEVAHHLPTAAAEMLGDANWEIQEFVLTNVRNFVCGLELSVTLDPIQMAAVLELYVAEHVQLGIGFFRAFERAGRALQHAQEIVSLMEQR